MTIKHAMVLNVIPKQFKLTRFDTGKRIQRHAATDKEELIKLD